LDIFDVLNRAANMVEQFFLRKIRSFKMYSDRFNGMPDLQVSVKNISISSFLTARIISLPRYVYTGLVKDLEKDRKDRKTVYSIWFFQIGFLRPELLNILQTRYKGI
jgi:hypothetical protein